MKGVSVDKKVTDEILFKSKGLNIIIGRNRQSISEELVRVLSEEKNDLSYVEVDSSDDLVNDLDLIQDIQDSDVVFFKEIEGAKDFTKALGVAAIGSSVVCTMEGENLNKVIDVLKMFARATGYDWFDIERHLLAGVYLIGKGGVKSHIFGEKVDLSVLPKRKEESAA